MTTVTWSDSIAHSNDTDFRKWGSQVSQKLQNAGLIQTADSGQVNWLTATRPSTSSTGNNYEIFMLGDSLSTTMPVYLKVYYGTNNTANAPGLYLMVGSGSNGSGGLTAPWSLSGTMSLFAQTGISNSLPVPSYICRNEGFLGAALFSGSTSTGTPDWCHMGFGVMRTCNNLGQPDARGLFIWGSNVGSSATGSSYNSRTIDFENSVLLKWTQSAGNNFVWPFINGNASLFNGDIQVMPGFIASPRITPMFGLGVCNNNEIGKGTTFSTALVGSTPRTYISLGSCPWGSMKVAANTSENSLYAAIMLWE